MNNQNKRASIAMAFLDLSAAIPKFAPDFKQPEVMRVWVEEFVEFEQSVIVKAFRDAIRSRADFPSISELRDFCTTFSKSYPMALPSGGGVTIESNLAAAMKQYSPQELHSGIALNVRLETPDCYNKQKMEDKIVRIVKWLSENDYPVDEVKRESGFATINGKRDTQEEFHAMIWVRKPMVLEIETTGVSDDPAVRAMFGSLMKSMT